MQSNCSVTYRNRIFYLTILCKLFFKTFYISSLRRNPSGFYTISKISQFISVKQWLHNWCAMCARKRSINNKNIIFIYQWYVTNALRQRTLNNILRGGNRKRSKFSLHYFFNNG